MNHQLDTYQLITVTHKTAGLNAVGEYVVKPQAEQSLQEALNELKSSFGMDELLYVATCNRVIFLFTQPQGTPHTDLSAFVSAIAPDIAPARWQEEVVHYVGDAAVQHFYEVASSIDSLVIGERQILGQLREAYDQCREMQLTGDNLRLLMRFAVTVAKRVYAQTRIGEKPVSVVSLAIKKMLDAQVPKSAKVLLVGAGQTNTLVSKFLKKYSYENVVVFNRSIERAQRLSQKFSGDYHGLHALDSQSHDFDVMIVCTGATEPIITSHNYPTILGTDTREKLIIDLAIPNNVDKSILDQHAIRYIEIDTLKALAEQNMQFRATEVEKAQDIVIEEITVFQEAYKQRQVERAMQAIPQQIKEVKSRALTQVFHKEIATLDDDTRALMERMLTYMEKKCISIPMTIAKDVMLKQQNAARP